MHSVFLTRFVEIKGIVDFLSFWVFSLIDAKNILFQHLASEIVLTDMMSDKLKGETMDMQHGLVFSKPIKVTSSEGTHYFFNE